MIIDAHTHIFGENIEESIKKLLHSMDDAGICKSAILAAPSTKATNKVVISISKQYPDRFFAVGYVSPRNPKSMLEEIRRWLESGKIRALKFYLGYEYYYPNDFALLSKYFEVLQETGFPAIFHTGDTYSADKKAKLKFAHPLAIDDVAVEFPKLKIIVAHLGNPWMMDAAAIVYKNENVFADISGLVYGDFKHQDTSYLSRRLGWEVRYYLETLNKLIFGSDYPIANQKSYVVFAKDLLSTLSDEEKKNIMFKNAYNLFKL